MVFRIQVGVNTQHVPGSVRIDNVVFTINTNFLTGKSHGGDILKKRGLVVKPPVLLLKLLGVPTVVRCRALGHLMCEVTALEVEATVLEPPEGLRVIGIVTTTPLRLGQEVILGGRNILTHEPLSSRDGFATDFPNVNPFGSGSGDLEVIDVGLIVSPGHFEEIADLDRSRSSVFVHRG